MLQAKNILYFLETRITVRFNVFNGAVSFSFTVNIFPFCGFEIGNL